MWRDMVAYMGNHGGGHWFLGGLMMIVFWGALIALAVFLVRGLTRSRDDTATHQRPTPLEYLQEHYARGEIDQQQYEQRKRDLMR